MKAFFAAAVGTASLLATAAAYAANGHMENAGPGGEVGAWVPLLFTVVVFGLLMWGLSQLARERLEGDEE